eukprot:gnl/MRDRNA2_/MRDRNA2_111483_c0_seq1.p1 gnl/MRDRNA2_/MRDRNA2_111483_c0~~gnl/MRDRNA2_/MRDRNA2_111483_c0_seq1.p1  ORF type:complete len:287 (+),score=49.90 gnl/MRDRNA2_/MRDRNA2_111483_c0_seq1:49-909(+)
MKAMNLHHCSTFEAVADAYALICRATSPVQGLWCQLGCRRRQAFQGVRTAVRNGRSPATLIIGLPEVLQAHVLEFAGNVAASSLSLASQELHLFLWQSMEVWQARLAFSGTNASIGHAAEFRREYRWKACGIDVLCKPGMLSGNGDHAMMCASRAVKALIAEDAPFSGLMSTTLARLVQSYNYTDDLAHKAAESLVRDVSVHCYMFNPEQCKNVSLAYDSACWMRETLLRQNSELAETLEEQFMDAFPDFLDEPDDVPDLARAPSGCDNEAIEHEMERLRSLPDSV